MSSTNRCNFFCRTECTKLLLDLGGRGCTQVEKMFKWCSHASPQQRSGEIVKDKGWEIDFKFERGRIARYVHVQPSNSCSDKDHQLHTKPVWQGTMEPSQEEDKALVNYSLIISTFLKDLYLLKATKWYSWYSSGPPSPSPILHLLTIQIIQGSHGGGGRGGHRARERCSRWRREQTSNQPNRGGQGILRVGFAEVW